MTAAAAVMIEPDADGRPLVVYQFAFFVSSIACGRSYSRRISPSSHDPVMQSLLKLSNLPRFSKAPPFR